MRPNLTGQDRADLARILRQLIEADSYPLSPKVRWLKELLAKIDPMPERAVTPYPAPKRAGHPSLLLRGIRTGGGEQPDDALRE